MRRFLENVNGWRTSCAIPTRRGVARELQGRGQELGQIIEEAEQLGQEYTNRRDKYQQFQNEAVRAQMEMGVSGGPPEIQQWDNERRRRRVEYLASEDSDPFKINDKLSLPEIQARNRERNQKLGELLQDMKKYGTGVNLEDIQRYQDMLESEITNWDKLTPDQFISVLEQKETIRHLVPRFNPYIQICLIF